MFLKPYLPIILQETTFTTRKELWLNVQVAMFFGTLDLNHRYIITIIQRRYDRGGGGGGIYPPNLSKLVPPLPSYIKRVHYRTEQFCLFITFA